MMELADMQDLGSCAERRVGSSPTIRIICETFFKIWWRGMSWDRFLSAVYAAENPDEDKHIVEEGC